MNCNLRSDAVGSARALGRHYLNRITPVLMFLALLSLYGLQLWGHATRASTTIDEPFHIVAGYRYWQCGDYAINPEHPPFLKLLATFPIRSQTLVDQPCGSRVTPKDQGFLMGGQFLVQNGVDQILVPARLAASLMSLLLGALVFLATREMFGQREAFVALALFVFEPNLIAHGSLVTTDMAFAATTFATVYTLYRYRCKPATSRLLVCGLAMGLMLASKHTGIVMVPVLFLLILADVCMKRTDLRRNLVNHTAAFTIVVLITLTLLWSTYGFHYYALPGATNPTLPVASLSDPNIQHSLMGRTVEFMGRTHVFPESYVYGLADVISQRQRLYLLGKVYPTARWFYFPVVFSIKTSIALLLLLPLALLIPALYREPAREMLFLLVPPLGYFAISLTSPLNIGVRHILVVYPFFIITAAAGVYALARRYRVFLFALVAVLLFHSLTALRTYPNYIAFVNDFWGGTNYAHRLFNDSNVDWGQNLKLIDDYSKKEHVENCYLAYFGNADIARINQRCHLMHAPFWEMTEEVIEPLPPVIDGLILLSAAVRERSLGAYDKLLKTEPNAIVGGSILVYRGRFELPMAAALSHIGRGNQLIRLKRFDEAIADGRRAMELVPNDSRFPLFVSRAVAVRGWNYLFARDGVGAVDDSLEYLRLEGWRGEMSPYMVLVAYYSYRLQHREQEAREVLNECVSKCDREAWPYPIVRYLQGEISATDLKALSVDNDKMTESCGYIGMNLSLQGRFHEAMEEFNWVEQHGKREFYEYNLAISEKRYIEGLVKTARGNLGPAH